MIGEAPRIFISSLDDGYLAAIQEGLEWVRLGLKLKWGDAVCVKPNLTFPTYREGAMTNPRALEALVIHLKNFTDKITICESDAGGYNRFSMDEVFRKTGIAEFARQHGVRICNMSLVQSRSVSCQIGRRKLYFPLPSFLLDEVDLFVTMPVPKVHCNTIVSLALKNQWGLIQDPALRLRLHPFFKEVIYEINKLLPRAFAVVDGKFGLDCNGPLRGESVELNWLLAGDDVYYTDYVVSQIMGIDYRKVPHLKFVFRRERIDSLQDVEFNQDYRRFKKRSFRLCREWTDYPGLLTFNSRLLAYIGYESILARPLHRLLYKFREPFY